MSSQSPLLKDLLALTSRQKVVMDYFLTNISVGEIIAVRDLNDEIKKRVKRGERDLVSEIDDAIIEREILADLAYLVKRGFLEYKNGVYSLSKPLRDFLKEKYGRLYPGKPKSIESILKDVK